MASESIGLIGIGLLGSALAERFLSAGFSVIGFDVESSRRDALGKLGGKPARSATEVVQQCRRTVLSLPTSDHVAKVLDEVERHLQAGATLTDTTTGDPDQIAAFGPRLARRGGQYLDATVGGSSKQVRASEAITFVGGNRETFEACKDLFACFTREAFYVGLCGSGARMKLVFNLALGLHRAVLAEALTLAEASGIEAAKALEILKAGAAYSRVMDNKGLKMVRGDFAAEARLSQHLKDVRLMLASAERLGARLPLSVLHRSLLEAAEAAGFGDADNSAIIKAFQ